MIEALYHITTTQYVQLLYREKDLQGLRFEVLQRSSEQGRMLTASEKNGPSVGLRVIYAIYHPGWTPARASQLVGCASWADQLGILSHNFHVKQQVPTICAKGGRCWSSKRILMD